MYVMNVTMTIDKGTLPYIYVQYTKWVRCSATNDYKSYQHPPKVPGFENVADFCTITTNSCQTDSHFQISMPWVDLGSFLQVQIQHILSTNKQGALVLPSCKSALFSRETIQWDRGGLNQEVAQSLYTQLPILEESFNDASFQVFL